MPRFRITIDVDQTSEEALHATVQSIGDNVVVVAVTPHAEAEALTSMLVAFEVEDAGPSSQRRYDDEEDSR